jgi:hypothetical protein
MDGDERKLGDSTVAGDFMGGDDRLASTADDGVLGM